MSDIFVVLPPLTANNCVLFAKNSDRPPSEVQEVVYFPAEDHETGSKVQCTFIEIDQVSHTNAVVLSKPAWSWGAEMGANDQGVCIGNTAVWTKLCHPGDHEEKLIGGDFVRLGLERANTASEAVSVITGLLERHGQGGLCCEDWSFGQWTYHNAYVIADKQEAWLLETAGKYWVARKFTSGIINTSSMLTIESNADAMSSNITEHAHTAGLWKPEDGEFNFAKVFSSEYLGISLSEAQNPSSRLKRGRQLLEKICKNGHVAAEHLFRVLRDSETSINFNGELLTVGSQVSTLSSPNSNIPHCHWFTATPDPDSSVFKPFIFCPGVQIGPWTVSPSYGERPRNSFQTSHDRRHALYKAHEKGRQLMDSGTTVGQKLKSTMKHIEDHCVREVTEFLQNFNESDICEVHDLFNDVCESETKFYK
ncbi:hypothetical protein CHS0354_014471 [Potamilus streckersoni]|uniref:Secernin-2 n=1 Tax=Potamilus streckersoni TaxID=2493646 RepID=A0AAE0VT13_9BIVA|nr:hypothetical protein CHS0354_014471 [Potamilus streckersoni]